MSCWGTIYNNTRAALQVQSDTLARLQEETSTGERIIRASDSPGEAYQIMNLRSQDASTTAYLSNIDSVDSTLQTMSTSLSAVSDMIPRANELLTQAASGTYSQDNRLAVANEIDSLLEQAVSQANSQYVGRYVFGGTNSDTPPYSVQRTDGKITSVQYVGGQENLSVPVAPGVEMPSMLVGESVFSNNRRGAVEFDGSTGAAAGTGTSSVRGDVYLTISHTSTAFDAATGLAAGTSSASGDTIVGSHTITIDAAAKTISLDSGPAVAFTGAETDLAVTNPDGDVTHINMTGWTGTGGASTIAATATMKIDGSTSTTVIDGTGNQAVTDSATGRILYVDSSKIKRTGVEPIRATGTYDLFNTLANIRDLLLNTRGFTEAQQSNLLNSAVSSLKEAAGGLSQATTSVGGRQGALDTLKTTLTTVSNTLQDQAGKLQNADLVDLATQLARFQNLYQATMSSAAKLLKLSILDYV